ncbi:MAG: hypothetical protein KBT14_02535, partial [Proteobacteria bacterium]|nr:hypothetical protein [Candidatus Enterousia onthequi]
MAIFRVFFIGVLCWTVCMPVFGANGAVTQAGETKRTSGSNSVDSATPSYSSGANGGGGASSASCSNNGEKCEVKKNGKTVGNGICNNKVCVAKECTAPYYLEHYTVVSDKNNGFKCSISGQKVITGISEYGDDVQVCGSKGICRTREQAKKANKCSVDAALLIVNGKTVIAGCQSIEKKSENCTSTQILKENACVDCPGCENVANGACEQLNSRGNVCQYKTSCNDGYELQSGTENTNSPICNPKKLKLNLEPEDEDEPDVIYQIKYELDGGKGCELVHGLVGNEIECVPTKDEFDFGGWCYDTEKTDCEGSDGKFTVKPGKTGIEITMYAKWSTKGQQSQDAQQRTECSEEEKAQFPHAIKFEFADGKCWVSVCETGYKLENGICVDDGIQEAEDKYKAAKEKEQSKANRMLGGLTMAATGIGG